MEKKHKSQSNNELELWGFFFIKAIYYYQLIFYFYCQQMFWVVLFLFIVEIKRNEY